MTNISATRATMAATVVELSELDGIADVELGGKAKQLGALIRAGFPVPGGFVLTTATFREFLRSSGLEQELRSIDVAYRESFETARARVVETPMPASISQAITDAYAAMGRPRVAVRSSAVGEDSVEFSFAGQHDTILNVEGDEAVVEAVRTCWASLWSDRAWAYRKVDGQRHDLQIAVIVQRMISAESAGVIFTTDPVEARPHHLVLEAALGLGEGLVSGRVTTDSYVVHTEQHTLIEKKIRYKVTRSVGVGGGGVELEKVPHEDRDQPVLSDAEAIEIAKIAIAIRDHYGAEQDIEWAREAGRFAILQSRPITTKPRTTTRIYPNVNDPAPAIKENILWSRMDIGEIFTGRMTPLGISFAKYYQYNIHSDCVRYLGIYELGDPAEYMGYAQGHVYLNISYAAWQLAQIPPGRDQARFTVRFASEEVDLAQYVNPYGQAPDVDIGHTTRYWMAWQVHELVTAKKRAEDMTQSRFREFDRFQALDLTQMSREELNLEMIRDLEYFRRMHYFYMPYYINAFGFYSQLQVLCAQWLGAEGSDLQNRLKGDMSNLRTVEGARAVWRLAQRAKQDPELVELIRTTRSEDVGARVLDLPAGRRFWDEAMVPFLRVNGFRGRQEMELAHPRWIDDPSYIFQMIRNYIVNDFSIDDVLNRGRDSRSIDTEAILSKLKLQHRALLSLLIKLYSTCSELREVARMAMVTSIWLVRRVLYEVGRRQVQAGHLRSLDDVQYLDFHDVLAYLAGRMPAEEAFGRQALATRRRAHLHNLRSPEPPLSFIGSYDPSRPYIHELSGDSITGLGASPGRVMGKARVVHDLWHQADEFQAGEILVTTFTDASWTPLFAVAGAVVTDIGSMLSHSSIVSREFNIPSVVNTKIATQVIKTGDTLVVDGDNGLVQVQKED